MPYSTVCFEVPMTRRNVCAQPAGKRKVGRPISYCGDPNSPDLTPAERRRIMRRIANRESARRVRARRLDILDEMAQKVGFLLLLSQQFVGALACHDLSGQARMSN